MPRPTNAVKEAERKAREEKEAAELKVYQETILPKKILELMAQANSIGGVEAYPTMATDGSGVNVEFSFPSTQEDYRIERVLSLKSEPYEVEQVESEFKILAEREEKARKKLQLAQEVYDNLSPEAREAIGLTNRPR